MSAFSQPELSAVLLLLRLPFYVVISQVCTDTLIEAPCTPVSSVQVLCRTARSLCKSPRIPAVQLSAAEVSYYSDSGNTTSCALHLTGLPSPTHG